MSDPNDCDGDGDGEEDDGEEDDVEEDDGKEDDGEGGKEDHEGDWWLLLILISPICVHLLDPLSNPNHFIIITITAPPTSTTALYSTLHRLPPLLCSCHNSRQPA